MAEGRTFLLALPLFCCSPHFVLFWTAEAESVEYGAPSKILTAGFCRIVGVVIARQEEVRLCARRDVPYGMVRPIYGSPRSRSEDSLQPAATEPHTQKGPPEREEQSQSERNNSMAAEPCRPPNHNINTTPPFIRTMLHSLLS